MVPHICCTSVPESHMSPVSYKWVNVLSYKPFKDKCTEWSHINDPTMSNILTCILWVFNSPKFQFFLLYDWPFLTYRMQFCFKFVPISFLSRLHACISPVGCRGWDKENSRGFFVVFFSRPERDSFKQEAQGLGAVIDKMEDNHHIKLDNRDLDASFTLRPAVFEAQSFWKSEIHRMTPRITCSI